MKKPKISILIELQYKAIDKKYNNYATTKGIEEMKIAHLDDNNLKELSGTVRCNFTAEIPIHNIVIMDIYNQIELIFQNKDIIKVEAICKKLQNLFINNCKIVFPDLKKTHSELVEHNWIEKLKGNKNKFEYHTVLYRFVEDFKLEIKILEILQSIIDEKLEKYFQFTAHFNCWQYYLNNKPASDLKEFIKHRNTQLNKLLN